MLNNYQSEYYMMMSYESIKEMLMNNEKIITELTIKTKKNEINSNVKKEESIIDYSTKPNIIMAILNETKWLSFLLNCRKQKSPLSYIYIGTNQYITFIIKNASMFPMIILKIPIDNRYSYGQPSEECYEFPLIDLITKQLKIKNLRYRLILQKNENLELLFSVQNGSEEKITKISDIKSVSKDVINEILRLDSIENRINYTENALVSFDNMNVLIIREVETLCNVINFNVRNSSRSQSYLELYNDSFKFIHKMNNKEDVIYLANKNDSLYWPNIIMSKKQYDIQPYDNLFKLNYTKALSAKDKLYYVFCTYLNVYMFIKIITPLVFIVDENINHSFIEIFNKEYQIIECYMVTERNI